MYLAVDSRMFFSSSNYFDSNKNGEIFWYKATRLYEFSNDGKTISFPSIILGAFIRVSIDEKNSNEDIYSIVIECDSTVYKIIFEKNEEKYETPTPQKFLEFFYNRFVARRNVD